ncbi:MAG: hypothetical protein WDN06_20150 [Asticcacaulis sp.]
MFDVCQLDPLIGLWKGDGEISASPWSRPGTCRGRWSFRFDPARRNLIHTYEESRADGSAFDGHGVFCADPDSEDLLWFWFDSYGFPPMEPARGELRQGVLVLTKHTPRGVGRSTFRLGKGGFDYLVEAQATGQPGFADVMHGTFERV